MVKTRIAALRSDRAHDRGDRRGETLPLRRFLVERAAAGARERVVLRAAIVVALRPLRGDPAVLLELVERRVQRALADLEHLARHLADALRDGPAVHRLERDHLEDEQV